MLAILITVCKFAEALTEQQFFKKHNNDSCKNRLSKLAQEDKKFFFLHAITSSQR